MRICVRGLYLCVLCVRVWGCSCTYVCVRIGLMYVCTLCVCLCIHHCAWSISMCTSCVCLCVRV